MARSSCLCAALLILGVLASASPVPEKLDAAARELLAGYRAKKGAAARPVVAVFTFGSGGRGRAGVAVSELLTHRLLALPDVVVVERSELRRVLEEQSLQASAAVDPESAVKVGRLLGAGLLVLGSVEKLGGRYGINARAVDAETGEVASATYQELSADAFEEASEPYRSLVPESQALGFYFLYNHRHNANRHPSYQADNFGVSPQVVSPRPFSMSLIGGGVRYFPAPRWLIDASVAVLSERLAVADISQPSYQHERKIPAGGLVLVRGTLNHVSPSFHGLRALVGAGLASYRVTPRRALYGTQIVPALRVGAEYKPQPRVGAGFFLNYDFLSRSGTDDYAAGARTFEFNRLSLEPTVAVYF